MFGIQFPYGRVFTNFPDREYINGKIAYIDKIDNVLFLVHDINEMMEILDCVEEGKVIYYHFKRPNWDLDFGKDALASDQDINHFKSCISLNTS